jgi:hypothetical protein
MINVTFTLFAYLMTSGVVFCCDELHFQGTRTKNVYLTGEGNWFSIYLEYCLFDSSISEISGQVNYNEKNCKHKVFQITVSGKAHIYVYV